MAMENMIEWLVHAIKSFDWYYDMTDDGSVWRRACDERTRITNTMNALTPEDHATVWAQVKDTVEAYKEFGNWVPRPKE